MANDPYDYFYSADNYVDQPTSANDGNAGEAAAQTAYQQDPGAYQSNWADSNAAALAVASGAIPSAFDWTGVDSFGGSDQASRAAMFAPRTGGPKPVDEGKQDDSLSDKVKKVMEWGKENNNNPFLMMALMGIANMGKNDFAREQASTQQQYRLAQMDKDAQIAKDKIAANSASVSGITPSAGIIQRRLARLNGNAVFNGNGIIQR